MDLVSLFSTTPVVLEAEIKLIAFFLSPELCIIYPNSTTYY
jgi:hypothetical protein